MASRVFSSTNQIRPLTRKLSRVSIREAQRRYDVFLNGELEALPGDAVMQRARSRLK
ncbi:MAG: hypothetical protein M3R52_06245 [Acidobacteriota bacterium]|nr:hypothetical protein [Acidobacteriota bacterium]